MNSQIINLTPHNVVLLDPSCAEYDPRTRSYAIVGDLLVIREWAGAEGSIPRCSQSEEDCDPIDGVPTVKVAFGEIENLPEPADDVYYIVSALAANAGRAAGRSDLLVPTRSVRGADGKIVGCLALAR